MLGLGKAGVEQCLGVGGGEFLDTLADQPLSSTGYPSALFQAGWQF